jgi:hypothetical protein
MMARGRKKNKAQEIELLVSIGNFDTRDPIVRAVYENVPLADARPIDRQDYVPSGGTPLNDAVLKFGGDLNDRFKANPNALHVGLLADESGSMSGLQNDVIEGFNTFLDSLKNDNTPTTEPGVIMVIMTDGYENSSTEDRDGSQVREFVKQREADGWNFFYLGANQDAWATGASHFDLGQTSTSMTFDHSHSGVRSGYGAMAASVNLRKFTPSHSHSIVTADALAGEGVMNYVGHGHAAKSDKDESEE